MLSIGASVENVLLAAQELGLGTLWIELVGAVIIRSFAAWVHWYMFLPPTLMIGY